MKRQIKALSTSLVAVALAIAWAGPADAARNFDARAELNERFSTSPGAAQQAAAARLRASLPEAAVTVDRVTGATRSLYNRVGYLTGRNPGVDPAAVALDFVDRNLALLGLEPGDLSDFEVTDNVYTAATGATRLYLRQRHAGLPVYNGVLQVNVNREGRVMGVSNGFLPAIAVAANTTRARLSVADAVASVAAHLDAAGDLASEGRLMWLPIRRGSARLVWNFQFATADGRHHYDFTVDAVSGKVWTRFDWVADAQYRVYEAPVESPDDTSPLPPSDGRTLQIDPQNPTASPNGWHDTGSTSYTITRGNNVHAYEDRDGNNLPPATDIDCGGTLSCDFPIDLTSNPPASIPAAVSNLFYWNNYIHDTQYLYGFDEAGGNFQVNNFGNGGAGNDDVRAEAQDNDLGGSNCNANFFTPTDGNRPRMQMFTCNAASPERDGDYDNLVIVHEYGHGISIRQVGGPSNSSCLGNRQQPGEGWSDLFGLIYTHQTGFAGTDARTVGSYLFNDPTGIRTFPYSTDFGVNPDTYSSIKGRSVPHGVGSVWAEVAWEAYWELVGFHGFDEDLQNTAANAGNHRAMLYFNEGLKNTACSPTFLDARDGVIQAATDNNGGEDVCRLWDAFARRGLGVDASTGGSNSTRGVDGFSVPASCSGGGFCGDGTCDTNEDECSCAADCGSPPTNEVPNSTCTDGIDNDCDEATDCADTDCNGIDPACVCSDPGESCLEDADCCSLDCSNGKPSTRTCQP